MDLGGVSPSVCRHGPDMLPPASGYRPAMPLDLVQDVTFETDSLALFEKMLPVAIETMRCDRLFRTRGALIWQYPSHGAAYLMSFLGHEPEDLARWTPPQDRPPPFYVPICRLTDRFRGGAPFDVEVPTTGLADTIRATLELVRGADPKALLQQTGEGPFRGCDGTVAAGYRLHGGTYTADLVVSLCHIYYSK